MGMIQRVIPTFVAAAALALALGCLLAALAALGGRWSSRLDLLSHFAPFWFAGALLSLGCSLLLGGVAFRPSVLVAGVAVLAAGALILPEVLRPVRAPLPTATRHLLKLIQLNAWSSNVDMPATVRWLLLQDADLVLVEEVTPALSAALLSHGYQRTRGTPRVEIYSRRPSQAPPFPLSEAEWHAMPSFARAQFAVDSQVYDVIAVHVGWPSDSAQPVQLATLRRIASRYDQDRLIVVGDFNLTPWSATLQRLDRSWPLERRDRALFSWPAQPFLSGRLRSPIAFLPIDHIYAGAAWRTVKIERGPRLGSDHYPVMITLALTD